LKCQEPDAPHQKGERDYLKIQREAIPRERGQRSRQIALGVERFDIYMPRGKGGAIREIRSHQTVFQNRPEGGWDKRMK